MPAYDSASCGRRCSSLSRVFFDAAVLARNGMAIDEVLLQLGNVLNSLEAQSKMSHTVWANGSDPWPGTLSQKLEAGNAVTLTEQAPTGTTGRAALERVIKIAAPKVMVSADDTTPDYLDEKLKSFAGDGTYLASEIATVNPAGDENLAVKILKTAVQATAPVGSSAAGGLRTFRYWYKSSGAAAEDIVVTLDSTIDWRDRLIFGMMGASNAANAKTDLLDAVAPPAQTTGTNYGLQYYSVGVASANAFDAGSFLVQANWAAFAAAVFVNQSGALQLRIDNNNAATVEEWAFSLGIVFSGQSLTTNFTEIGNGF